MDSVIPFSSEDSIMIVAVRGTDDYHHGWQHVLENFYYECGRNNGSFRRRPATPYIAFYRTKDPKAITHWGRVKEITEGDEWRTYKLRSLVQLDTPIPVGKIPPNFSGGCVEMPLEEFFKIKDLDQVYSKNRISKNPQIPRLFNLVEEYFSKLFKSEKKMNGINFYTNEKLVFWLGDLGNYGFEVKIFNYKEVVSVFNLFKEIISKYLDEYPECQIPAIIQVDFSSLDTVRIIFKKVFFEKIVHDMHPDDIKFFVIELIDTMTKKQ